MAGQLAEDGIYPDAMAAFAAAEKDGALQPVRDYSPDQPRDPDGRWTEGGGTSSQQSEAAAKKGVTIGAPHKLTIHPKEGHVSPSRAAHGTSSTASSLSAKISGALEFLNPISAAQAAGADEEENRSAEEESYPTSEIQVARYYSAYNELKAINPKNPEFGPALRPTDWTPSNEDVQRVETALQFARSGQAGSSALTAPRKDPNSVSPFAPSSERVNRAAPEPPMSMPRSPTEEMLERIARENPLRLNVGRATVPQGAFGSIVRANGVTIRVDGNSPRELGYSYEQGIRDTVGSGKLKETFVAHISRFVDDVVDQRVFEAKHVDVYVEAIYNPRLAEPWHVLRSTRWFARLARSHELTKVARSTSRTTRTLPQTTPRSSSGMAFPSSGL
ncbi:hypothetical protein [Lichenifustis flavocetrariae]|uniref:Uncharacterized protein n=1 Tax=Lichenifustis flavocetrariae TaxID=2949735 RepID=A0AA41Z8R1_9HYPH|nr:hypothetical protein [Lichenifustis flavocetrariae]MCW6511412.1 hypothetical protein [Lichenifustis flavocetrariae]